MCCDDDFSLGRTDGCTSSYVTNVNIDDGNDSNGYTLITGFRVYTGWVLDSVAFSLGTCVGNCLSTKFGKSWEKNLL